MLVFFFKEHSGTWPPEIVFRSIILNLTQRRLRFQCSVNLNHGSNAERVRQICAQLCGIFRLKSAINFEKTCQL